MPQPLRTQALSELTPEDLRAMLAENETLFVEHKTALGGQGYAAAKAIASVANTLGGWLLIGLTEGAPNAGSENGWTPVAPHELVDLVRQVLEENVDPVPPFAATVLELDGAPIGVVRVYESTDTPHIMRPNSAIYVRSIARDGDLHKRPRYLATGAENQATLFALLERGERAQAKVSALLQTRSTPLVANELGLDGANLLRVRGPAVVVRGAPFTRGRMVDWAVSEAAREALTDAARGLARRWDADEPVDFQPRAAGLAVRVRADRQPLADGIINDRDWVARAVSDVAGVVGVGIYFGVRDPPQPKTVLSLDDLRAFVFEPLLAAAVDILLAGEFYGRTLFELQVASLDRVFDLYHGGEERPLPSRFPTGGELSLPGATAERDGGPTDLEQLADQWRADYGREAGYLELR